MLPALRELVVSANDSDDILNGDSEKSLEVQPAELYGGLIALTQVIGAIVHRIERDHPGSAASIANALQRILDAPLDGADAVVRRGHFNMIVQVRDMVHLLASQDADPS